MKNGNNRPILPVILAGGCGTRLWPMSTPSYPKQFLALFDNLSFFQKTVQRVSSLPNVLNPLIICNESHLSLVQSHLEQISVSPLLIITEPVGRNTAPAITMAAMQQVEQLDDPILLVLPSDQVITDQHVFENAILSAARYAEQERLVTFGMMPNYPNVHYGYIKATSCLNDDYCFFYVEKFVEKPNLEKAKHYLKSGQYHWNSGMFMFRASVFLKELSLFEPDIFYCCELINPKLSLNTIEKVARIPLSIFQLCPRKSIDYAIMEKTKNAVVMPLNVGWSDLGSWQALWRYHSKDANGNAVWGDVTLDNVEQSLIYVQNKSIALKEIKNRVIVHANNEVFETKLCKT